MVRIIHRVAIVLVVSGLVAGCSAEPAGETKTLEVTASAYNSVVAQTDGKPNLAAWGDELKPGMKAIAVSPDLVDLGLDHGTEVTIEGLSGTYRVLDRTASRHTKRIDIYMGTDVEAAKEWGIQEVTISWQAAE